MLNKKFIAIIAAAIMVYLGINAFAQPSEDTTAPIITLNGDAIMTINVGTNFVDPGATAQDDVDGNLTSEIVVTGDVDEDTLGTYQLRYNVSDNAGNAAEEVVRTVNVINPDPNAPIITLLGANPYIIEVDGTYVEPGARAEDDVDGEMILTDENITGEVDTSRLGTYLLYYDITDSNGNKALTVTRVVRVVDTAAPVITLNGASEVRIEVNGTYNELGATATDNYNQNLTVVIDDSELNLNALGTYKIYYNATDLSGNAAETVERTVIVQDTTAPVITLNEESEVKIEINGIYDELGASVIDNYDTNLTVVIDDSELNLNALGTYKIYYNATDSSGNAAETVERTVIVQDTTAPQNLTFAPIKHETLEGRKDFYNLNYTTLTGYDAGDGEYCSTNTPYRIRYVREYTDGYSHNNLTEVDLSRIGKYRLDYRLCDSHNNCATTYKFVHVVDNTTPTIVLDPSFVTRYEEGMAKPDFSDAILEYYDNIEQPLTIDIIENIDMNTPGVYPVTIRVTETESTTWDGSPRALLWDEATINIEVVEATPQAIKFVPKRHETLNGRRDFYDISSTTVTAYDEYEERNIEGNSPYNISYVREYIDINTPYAETNLTEIDLSRIGKYKLDYRLCDISNHCVTGYKNIYIQDVEAPTITLDSSFIIRYDEDVEEPDWANMILNYSSDNINQPLTATIIAGDVDMNTPDIYPITIRVTETEDTNWDGSPRELLSTDITIDIEIVDTTPPVVTLDGNSTIYIRANMDEFIEPGQGSTAVDNATDTSNLVFRKLIEYVDPITGKFIKQDYTDHVDNTKVGRYKIWYYYTDENGNTGHAIRNVYVVHTPMEITTNIPTFTMNVPASFEIGTIANSDVGEMVRAHFVIPEGAVIEYKETPTGPWKPLVDVFGPSIGFPLGDITTTLRGTLTKEVTEPVTVQFKKLDGEVLGEINIDVNVEYVPMEITTNIPTFTMNVPASFEIGTIANSDVGEMVRAHFVIPEGAVIEYKETPTGPWKPLVDVFGPSIGFPLGDITTTLRGTFSNIGTYTSIVEFRTVEGNILLGSKELTAIVTE
ncbi:MAG: immunoglobulin-like domain-containing protein [Bacilli bacterium]